MYGEIPCVRNLTKEEIDEAYEKNTGVLIVEHFKGTEYMAMPAVLCKTTDHLPGEPIHTMQYIMQSYSKK